MSEKQLQKFHTDEALTPRTQGSDFNWLIKQVCHMARLIRIYSKVDSNYSNYHIHTRTTHLNILDCVIICNH